MNQKILEKMKTLSKSWNKKRRVTARHPSTRANLGKTILLYDLLASSKFMASELRSRGERRKGELVTISYKFSFLLHPDEAKYHWLKKDAPPINFDWWHSWPTCPRNTMLTENGKIMVTCTPFSGEEHDRSLLLRSVNNFWWLYGCIFYRSVWISISLNI